MAKNLFGLVNYLIVTIHNTSEKTPTSQKCIGSLDNVEIRVQSTGGELFLVK